jgi:hypothetical protein
VNAQHGGQRRVRDCQPADLAIELDSFEAGAGDSPVARGELQKPLARPEREYAEDIAQVDLGIELVQAGRGDE